MIDIVEFIMGTLMAALGDSVPGAGIADDSGGGLSTFTGWSSRGGWALAIVLTGVLSAVIATGLLYLRQRDLALHRPTWRRVAVRMGLSRGQRRLVQSMARALEGGGGGGIHPASVLISEGTFAEAMKAHAARHGRTEAVEGLRRVVFG